MSELPTINYHRAPLKLHPNDPVLGAIKEDRLLALGEMRMIGKIGEADLLIMEEAVLCKPTAIFRGLKRPMSIPGYPAWYDEGRVIAVVARPDYGVDVSKGKPERCAPPAASVFVAYIRRVSDDGQRDQIRRTLAADHQAVYLVFHWEWVFCDPANPALPEDHATRYAEKLPWP